MDMVIAFVLMIVVVSVLSYTVLYIGDRSFRLLLCGTASFGVVGIASPVALRFGFTAFYQDDLWFTLVCVVFSFILVYAYVSRGWAYTGSPVLIDKRRQAAKGRKTVSKVTPKQVVLDTEGASTIWEM